MSLKSMESPRELTSEEGVPSMDAGMDLSDTARPAGQETDERVWSALRRGEYRPTDEETESTLRWAM